MLKLHTCSSRNFESVTRGRKEYPGRSLFMKRLLKVPYKKHGVQKSELSQKLRHSRVEKQRRS
jgi:hypothetical protein